MMVCHYPVAIFLWKLLRLLQSQVSVLWEELWNLCLYTPICRHRPMNCFLHTSCFSLLIVPFHTSSLTFSFHLSFLFVVFFSGVGKTVWRVRAQQPLFHMSWSEPVSWRVSIWNSTRSQAHCCPSACGTSQNLPPTNDIYTPGMSIRQLKNSPNICVGWVWQKNTRTKNTDDASFSDVQRQLSANQLQWFASSYLCFDVTSNCQNWKAS